MSHDERVSPDMPGAAPDAEPDAASDQRSLARLLHFSSLSLRDLTTIYLPVLVAIGILLWVAYVWIDPTPPKHVVMATGLDGSVYQDFAQQYKTILARHHIDLEIRSSEGSMQNLHSLNTDRSDADVAFVQSGTTNDTVADRRGLVSLGSLFVEPVWIFYREAALKKVRPMAPLQTSPRAPTAVDRARLVRPVRDRASPVTAITQLGELRGLTLNVGPKGSGGPRLAHLLLSANRVEPDDLTLSMLPETAAVMKLLDGSLDAAMLVTTSDDPMVQMLMQTPGIKVFSFDQAEAYARRFPFLTHVVLPRGIVALEKDLPHQDVNLIAPTGTLVARSTTHPAIIELLMQAAGEIHGGPGWFRKEGDFPNDRYTEVPVSPVAERYYRSGPPFLQRYLPFWLANLIERMGVVIVPLIALLIPLSRVLPPLYSWRVRKRVYRWYGQLRAVENDIDDSASEAAASAEPVGALAVADMQRGERARKKKARSTRRARQLARLADIESKVNHLVVPLSYATELYALKLHIDRVRDKLPPEAGARDMRPPPAHVEPDAVAARP